MSALTELREMWKPYITDPKGRGGFDLAKIVDDGLRGIIYPSTRGGQIVRCDIEKKWVDGPGSVLVAIWEVA